MPTHPGHRELEPATDASGDRSGGAVSRRASRRPAGNRDRQGCPERASVGPDVAIPRAAAPRRFGRAGLRLDRLGCGRLSDPPKHRPARGHPDVPLGMVQLAVAVATVTLVLVTGIEGILASGPRSSSRPAHSRRSPPGGSWDRHGRIPFSAAAAWPASSAGRHSAWYGSSPRRSSSSGSRCSASPGDDAARAGRGRRHVPARATRPRNLLRALRRALRARSARSSSGPLLAGKAALTPTRSSSPGSPPAGSWSSGSCSSSLSGPTRRRSLAAHFDAGGSTMRTSAPLSRDHPRGRASSPRSSPRSRASAAWSRVMNLSGYVVIDHGHHQTDVFTVISLHIVGMYALVLVVGPRRPDRPPSRRRSSGCS